MRVTTPLAVLVSIATSTAALADTINVPADQPTIQAAIDFAVDGDVVLVAPGTYVENINFSGKNIVVESSDGAATTTIDGNGIGTVVVFTQGETREAVIRGFTITNGNGSSEGYGGGGIRTNGASPTIEENIVTGNTANTGGGISLNFSSALVRNNEIISNSGGSGVSGGGMKIGGSASAEVYDNVIAFNTASEGAGIRMWAAGSPTIARNEIYGNTATRAGGAFAMANRSDVLIENNMIYNNSANEGGAFYWLIPSSRPVVRNNTIYDNTTSDVDSATMHTDGYDGNGIISGNIVVAPDGETAFYCGDFNDPLIPTFEANNVVANNGVLYTGICADQTGSNSNISMDPSFADPANADFRLVAGSPMVDASVDNPEVVDDFFSNPRPVDGDNDMVATPDIGAFEAAPPVADAGSDSAVNGNTRVTLDGSASYDPDGTTLVFSWEQVAGTSAALTDAGTATPSFTAPNSDTTLQFELTVTDDLGFASTDQVSIAVSRVGDSGGNDNGGGGGGGSIGPYLLVYLALLGLVRRRRGIQESLSSAVG